MRPVYSVNSQSFQMFKPITPTWDELIAFMILRYYCSKWTYILTSFEAGWTSIQSPQLCFPELSLRFSSIITDVFSLESQSNAKLLGNLQPLGKSTSLRIIKNTSLCTLVIPAWLQIKNSGPHHLLLMEHVPCGVCLLCERFKPWIPLRQQQNS